MQTMQNTAKQNYPGSTASYNTRPVNKTGLFYNAPEPTHTCRHTCTDAQISHNIW